MTQIGTIRFNTADGNVSLPVFNTADKGNNVYDMIRVQTPSGVGFVPFVDPSSSNYPYLRIKTQNHGVLAAHDKAALHFFKDTFEGQSTGTVPDGWRRDGDGTRGTVSVDNGRTYAGSRSVRSRQPNTGAPSHWHFWQPNFNPPGDYKLTFYVNVNRKLNSGSADAFSFYNVERGGNNTNYYAWDINFVSDHSNGRGIVVKDGNGSGNYNKIRLVGAQYDVWLKAEIWCYFSNNSYNVTVTRLSDNSSWSANNLGFRHNGNANRYDTIEHRNDNYDGWFDSFKATQI